MAAMKNLMNLTTAERLFVRKWVRESMYAAALWDKALNPTPEEIPVHTVLKAIPGAAINMHFLACAMSHEANDAMYDESLDGINPPWPWSSEEEFDQRGREAKAIVLARDNEEQKARTKP